MKSEEHIVIINDLEINYKMFGKGIPVLILHGWGQSSECFNNLKEISNHNFCFYVLDLPGFGKSACPNFLWNYDDYANFLVEFCEKINIISPIILGHSFGGKIAVYLATKIDTKKLIIYSSHLSNEKSLFKIMNIYLIKVLKNICPISLFQIHTVFLHPNNYNNIYLKNTERSKLMLSIYENLNFDKGKYRDLSQEVKVLHIIGSHDFIQKKNFFRRNEKDVLCKNEKIEIFKYSGHFSHITEKVKFQNVIIEFIRS